MDILHRHGEARNRPMELSLGDLSLLAEDDDTGRLLPSVDELREKMEKEGIDELDGTE